MNTACGIGLQDGAWLDITISLERERGGEVSGVTWSNILLPVRRADWLFPVSDAYYSVLI